VVAGVGEGRSFHGWLAWVGGWLWPAGVSSPVVVGVCVAVVAGGGYEEHTVFRRCATPEIIKIDRTEGNSSFGLLWRGNIGYK